MSVRRFADARALTRAAAEAIATAIVAAIEARGACRLALAGGSTPRPIYERLTLVTGIDWGAVEVFFTDERCVPPADEASNFRMAQNALLAHVDLSPAQVHRIEAERGAAVAAAAYARVLGAAPLDLVLLGMGEDGHTASLFPGRPELDEAEASVVAARAPVWPHERVSMTLPVIAGARLAWFLVAGAGKAPRLAQVFAEIERGERVLPAARVQPTDGELAWFLDEAAAQRV